MPGTAPGRRIGLKAGGWEGEPIIANGRLHCCNAAGAHGRGDAAYLLHLDGLPAGYLPVKRRALELMARLLEQLGTTNVVPIKRAGQV